MSVIGPRKEHLVTPDIIVLKPGARVKLEGGQPGQVLEVCISANACITYKVVWWQGSTRYESWLAESEITECRDYYDRTVIGFRQAKPSIT